MSRRVEPLPRLRGAVRVPGDKSGSHRALMLSALASGESVIDGLSPGHDVRATSAILCALGAHRADEDGRVVVVGPPEGLRPSEADLECENSGTTMRLMSGVVSGVEGHHRLVGDASLSRRPMDRVAVPLRSMGARVRGVGERVTAPLEIDGTTSLCGIDYDVPTPSAQVKSALLLAGLRASGTTTVRESLRTRTTTEDMLRLAGVVVASTDLDEGRVVTLTPGRPLARHWRVPADPSQAAFFCVLAAVHPDADLEVLDVDGSPERIGFISVLERMGVQVHATPGHEAGLVSWRVTSSSLTATEIEAKEIPSVDEVPALTVAAAAASGVSVFRDMGELRVKESDRFAGAMDLARRLGARSWADGDDFYVEGLGSSSKFEDFVVNAGLDHRFVMSAAVAAAAGRGGVIDGEATVASSYPHFFSDLGSLT